MLLNTFHVLLKKQCHDLSSKNSNSTHYIQFLYNIFNSLETIKI